MTNSRRGLYPAILLQKLSEAKSAPALAQDCTIPLRSIYYALRYLERKNLARRISGRPQLWIRIPKNLVETGFRDAKTGCVDLTT